MTDELMFSLLAARMSEDVAHAGAVVATALA